MTLIAPASQYCACHRFHTSITWVVPQAMSKIPKSANIQLKGRSRRLGMNHSSQPNSEIRERNQSVRYHIQPHQAGIPLVA